MPVRRGKLRGEQLFNGRRKSGSQWSKRLFAAAYFRQHFGRWICDWVADGGVGEVLCDEESESN